MNPKCDALGLTGDCCPNNKGIFLNCCQSDSAPVTLEAIIPTPAPSPSSFVESSANNSVPVGSPPTAPQSSVGGDSNRTKLIELKCAMSESNRKKLITALIEDTSDDVTLEDSPAFKAFNWLENLDGMILCPGDQYPLLQRYSCAVLYFAMKGSDWFNCSSTSVECTGSSKWLGSTDECGWYGITCDNDARITGISLKENNLAGKIPSEISLLKNLRALSLDHNNITGTIPESIGSLSRLVSLELDDNSIAGTIPDSLYSITTLQALDMNDNLITGNLKDDIGNLLNLVLLQVENNELQGEIPWFGLAKLDELRTFQGFVVCLLLQFAFSNPFIYFLCKYTTVVLYLHGNNFSAGASLESVCSILDSRRQANPGYLQFFSAGCDVNCTCCSECF